MQRSVGKRLITASVIGLVLGACAGEHAAGSEPRASVVLQELTSSDGRVSATVTLESDWGSGYRAKVTLTSNSSTPTTGWTVVVNLNGSTMSSCDLDSTSPKTPASGSVTITNKSWNAAVSSSASVSFGFNGAGSGRPMLTSVSYAGTGPSNGAAGSGSGGASSAGSGGSGSGGKAGPNGGASTAGAPPTQSGNPFAGSAFHVDSNLQACRSSSSAAREICATAQADWIGNWSGNVTEAVRSSLSRAGSQLKVLVAYNIYNRDCGGQSAGGASSPQAYRDWITAFANGIGNSKAVVILEPDALAHNCGASSSSDGTAALLKYAVQTLRAKPNTFVYIDAGHARWIDASTMATRLRGAGIEAASGFALNVSNFQATDVTVSYGKQVSSGVGGKPFVVDTSRNGVGATDTAWCNPRPRGLGKKSSAATGDPLVHAFYWIKRPGESDGACNGGPAAGQWFEDYAQHLYTNARF